MYLKALLLIKNVKKQELKTGSALGKLRISEMCEFSSFEGTRCFSKKGSLFIYKNIKADVKESWEFFITEI